jgi:NitT/TauT family transport system substrate-binding protein
VARKTSRALGAAFIGALILLAAAACSREGAGDRKALTIAVGGQTVLAYLPLTMADRLGYFRDEGLDVTIVDLKGGSEAMAALLGGSAEFVTGFYEHTIRAQAQGKHLKTVVLFNRFPGLVLMVGKKYADQVRSVKDLVGKPVGVTAPGSSTDQMLKFLLGKHGLDPQSVPVVTAGAGTTMIAALQQDRIWAGVTLDPIATKLEKDGIAVKLYDTRTEKGTVDVFGGSWPAGGIYTTQEFIDANPQIVRAVVNAALRTLDFVRTHPADEIAASMPEEFMPGGREDYVESLRNNLAMFSPDGRMSEEGPQNVLRTLQLVDPSLTADRIDLSKTYTNDFISPIR